MKRTVVKGAGDARLHDDRSACAPCADDTSMTDVTDSSDRDLCLISNNYRSTVLRKC